MFFHRLSLLCLLLISCITLFAQVPQPKTAIYLRSLAISDSGASIGNIWFKTNNRGYDDHPSFSQDSKYMYYTTEANDYRTDINAVYIPEAKNLEFIVTDGVSEMMPYQKPDMTGLAVLQVSDDKKDKRIVIYNTDGSNQVLTSKVNNIQSYGWLNDNLIAIKTDKPANVLGTYSIASQTFDSLTRFSGESIAKIPSENGIYYGGEERGKFRLYRYYYDIKRNDTLLHLPDGAKFFTVAVDGSVWSVGHGNVYRWPRAASGWQLVHKLEPEMQNGYRVAISRDMAWIAIVAEKKE